MQTTALAWWWYVKVTPPIISNGFPNKAGYLFEKIEYICEIFVIPVQNSVLR